MKVAVAGDFSNYLVELEFGIRLARLVGTEVTFFNQSRRVHSSYTLAASSVDQVFIGRAGRTVFSRNRQPFKAIIGDGIAQILAESAGALWIPVTGLADHIPVMSDHNTPRGRICVFGPESCGKSTLTRELAQAIAGYPVSEYARIFYEALQREPIYEDLLFVGFGQSVLEDMCARGSSPFIVCDTDALTTVVWSRFLFDRVDQKLYEFGITRARNYNSYLLLDVDLPWIPDKVRYLPDERGSFLDACREMLHNAGIKYYFVTGRNNERLQSALEGLRPDF
jgi:nicotinamide riboside kinase